VLEFNGFDLRISPVMEETFSSLFWTILCLMLEFNGTIAFIPRIIEPKKKLFERVSSWFSPRARI